MDKPKLPLRVDKVSGTVVDARGYFFARTGFYKLDDPQFIVQACNSYEMLVSALTECPLPSTMGNVATHYRQFYDWYNKVAVPALSQARGEGE